MIRLAETSLEPVPHPTIKRIAELAGVSKSAVSYALNGKPGVSEPTRQRILEVANELAWRPSKTARSLVGGHAGAIGMLINRPARLLGMEPFYMEFIAGLQEVLAPKDLLLSLRVASSLDDEMATYQAWASSKAVDGVLLTDMKQGDPRPELVRGLGLPFVVVGPQPDEYSVARWTADADAMREAVRYLVALGHRQIDRVAGPSSHLHIEARTAAMVDEMDKLGLAPPVVVSTDLGQEHGQQATRRLLSQPNRPSAIIYDNDVMAAVALAVAEEMGVEVPGDVSIVAWDNSLLSQLSRPPLTSTSVQVHDYSMAVVEALLELIDGGHPESGQFGEAGLAVRGSTARPGKR